MVQTRELSAKSGHNQKSHKQLTGTDQHVDWLLPGFILLLMLLVSLVFRAG